MVYTSRVMGDSFDLNEYISYIRNRWWHCLIACAVAVLVAVGISSLIPKQYSATARILIEPPPSSDGRATVSMSPAYLDSLRSYENLASSDTLFQQAVERFGLRESNSTEAWESLKRRVLRVTKPRNLKVLLITVTLPDPKKAAGTAAFLAAGSVDLSNSTEDPAKSVRASEENKQLAAAERQLEEARASLEAEDRRGLLSTLRAEVDSLIRLKSAVKERLSKTSEALAGGDDSSLQQRLRELERQVAELDHQVKQDSETLAQRSTRRAELQAGVDTALARVRYMRSTAGLPGERLRVIDSGTVPEKPSSPNVVLNATVAMVLALSASILYLTVGFSIHRARAARSFLDSIEPVHDRRG